MTVYEFIRTYYGCAIYDCKFTIMTRKKSVEKIIDRHCALSDIPYADKKVRSWCVSKASILCDGIIEIYVHIEKED